MIGLISLLKEIQGKPKAIFMAGPAGSGKSTILKQLVPSNFKSINVDDTYEELLHSTGLGTNIKNFTPDQLSQAAKLMSVARKTTDKKYIELSKGLQNIVIDGTGGSTKPLLRRKAELEDLGYDTFMIMLYVSPITSLERNINRERSLLPFIVIRTWHDVINNIDAYKHAFGGDIAVIDNDSKDANKEFDKDYIYNTFIKPLGQIGKPKSPEEIAKSKAEREQMEANIEQLIQTQPEFETIEQAKNKITNFIKK